MCECSNLWTFFQLHKNKTAIYFYFNLSRSPGLSNSKPPFLFAKIAEKIEIKEQKHTLTNSKNGQLTKIFRETMVFILANISVETLVFVL